jgi:hypothetical protein
MNEIDRLQQTVLELDNQLNMAQRESEDICMRYEANTVSKKQARPIKDHYTSLLATMTTHKTQLKQEVVRLKRKCAELEEQLAAVKFNFIFILTYKLIIILVYSAKKRWTPSVVWTMRIIWF